MVLRYHFLFIILGLTTSCLYQGVDSGRSLSSVDEESLHLSSESSEKKSLATKTQLKKYQALEDLHPPMIFLDDESVQLNEDGDEKTLYVILKDKDSPVSCEQLKMSSSQLVTQRFSGSPPYCKLHLKPLENKAGDEEIFLTIHNGQEATKKFYLTIKEIDDPPEIILKNSYVKFIEDGVPQVIELQLKDVDNSVSCRDVKVSFNELVEVKISGESEICYAEITPLKDQFGSSKIMFHYMNTQAVTAILDLSVLSIDDSPQLELKRKELTFNEDGLDQELPIEIADVDSHIECSQLSAPANDLVSVFFTGESPHCFANIIPKNNQHGDIELPIHLTNSLSTTESISIKVRPVDDPPQITLSTKEMIFKEDDGPKVLALNLNDVDSPISCSQIKIKTHGSTHFLSPLSVVGSGNSCSVNISPIPEKSGTVSIIFSIHNGLQDKASLKVTVQAVDDPPFFEIENQSLHIQENESSQTLSFKIIDIDSKVRCSDVQVKGDTQFFSTLSIVTHNKECHLEYSPKFNTTGKGTIQLEVINAPHIFKGVSFFITPHLAPPSSLTLISPSFSPDSNPTPTIRVSPVKIGETVKLFRDSKCKEEISSGIATNNEYIDLTTISLKAGHYKIYAKSQNSYQSSSGCSKDYVSYTLNINSNFEFQGLSSISDKTDTTVILHWKSHPKAISYSIYDTLRDQPLLLQKVLGHNKNSIKLVGLTPFSTYRFRVRLQSKEGFYDNNSNDFSVTMNGAPSSPTRLEMISDQKSHEENEPIIRIEGVKEGDLVTLYSDSRCTQEVTSQVARGKSIDMKLFNLDDGIYHFYATSTNRMGSSSLCSSSTVSYQKKTCPPHYLEVQRNRKLGTHKNFCVAKYEMVKHQGRAQSKPGSVPWVNISIKEAQEKCHELGENFELISNAHWMTIAHEIEKNEKNWIIEDEKRLSLYKGHSDSRPSKVLATSSKDSDPYFLTQNSKNDPLGSGLEQRRTFYLNKDQIIWDFSGNAWEWVNWLAQKEIIYPPHCESSTWKEMNDLSCQGLLQSEYSPLLDSKSSQKNISSLQYGKFMSSGSSPALRGGKWNLKTASGIYSLYWKEGREEKNADTGFRCVFTPP